MRLWKSSCISCSAEFYIACDLLSCRKIVFINGFAKGKTCIYFLFTFCQLKVSSTAVWGQRLLKAGAASFCVSAAECQFSLGLSHTRVLRNCCFFHFTDPKDLTSGQWFMVSMPL